MMIKARVLFPTKKHPVRGMEVEVDATTAKKFPDSYLSLEEEARKKEAEQLSAERAVSQYHEAKAQLRESHQKQVESEALFAREFAKKTAELAAVADQRAKQDAERLKLERELREAKERAEALAGAEDRAKRAEAELAAIKAAAEPPKKPEKVKAG